MGNWLRVPSLGLLAFLLACAHHAPPKTATDQGPPGQEQILPLVRLRLYASGVGYFERHGNVSAGQRRLPVPLGHLDDALKSLVLLNSDSEQLSLSFPSRVSPAVARARAGMAAAENAALSYDRLLAALRGERVVVTLGSAARFGKTQVSGRVIEVVSVEPTHPSYDHGPPGATLRKEKGEGDGEETPAPERARLQVMLLSPEYGVIRFDLSELVSVRPIDPRIVERFEAALSARIATRANPTEWLEMAGTDRALRDLRLGYLAETPIWRTSYRLVVGDGGRAELQAWALVHNDTDETWHDVKLELVDDYPSSFLFPLAAPRYQRRELSTPSEELSSVPQLSTTTPDAMWGDFSDYQGEVVESIAGESFGAGGLGLSGVGHGGGGRGEGVGLGSIGTLGHGAGVPPGVSDLIWVGDLQKQAGVIPPAERAVSIYQVKKPLHLLPQHSALLPFLREKVSAKTIVWFSSPSSAPERAIGITNNTRNTLPEGPMAVFGRGGFLGEAMLDSLQPGARQFARIGDEADFDLSVAESKTESVRRHVDFLNDRLRVHSVATWKPSLVFNNRSGAPAEIYVGMSLVNNSVLEGSDRLDFDSTAGTPFAVFDVPAGPGTERNLMARQGIAEGQAVDALDLDDLDELIRDQNLPSEERAILTKARPLLEQRLATVRAQEELEVELDSAKEELKSLKQTTEDVGAKESKEAGAVMTHRVLAALDNVRKIEARKRNLDKELETRTRALKSTLSELNTFRAKLVEERKRAEAAAR
ncbi:MAG: hypothetical protein JW940_08025 [Polyangiaceae bacterium]|nr:hypothetical protein [Polyangiaceae bacterium]